MAYPFRPMTNDILKKLSIVNREFYATEKCCHDSDIMEFPKTRPIEELNPQRPETNPPQLSH